MAECHITEGTVKNHVKSILSELRANITRDWGGKELLLPQPLRGIAQQLAIATTGDTSALRASA